VATDAGAIGDASDGMQPEASARRRGNVGDTCENRWGPEHYLCSLDGLWMLECRDGKLQPAADCRGPRGCTITEEGDPNPCDDSVAREGEVCISIEPTCSEDAHVILTCDHEHWTANRTCGKGQCIHRDLLVGCSWPPTPQEERTRARIRACCAALRAEAGKPGAHPMLQFLPSTCDVAANQIDPPGDEDIKWLRKNLTVQGLSLPQACRL
jgi:hypothetical protein